MRYRNAAEVLPAKLLRQLQRYAAGETLYIPQAEARRPWGEASGARAYYARRNEAIRQAYAAKASIAHLAETYGLSEDTIRKILFG